jgi:hypothetical protein
MSSTPSDRENEVFSEECVRQFDCPGIENLLRTLAFRKRMASLPCFPSTPTYKTDPRTRLRGDNSKQNPQFPEPEQEFALDLRKSEFNVFLFLLVLLILVS